MKRKTLVQRKRKNQEKHPENTLKNYARYSSLAFQMMLIMVAGAAAGRFLDRTINWHFPVFTLVLTILAVILAIYIAIKDFIHFK